MYKISNHKLTGEITPIEYHKTKKKSGKIVPKFLVIHYTAGSSFTNDVYTLSASKAKVSCHIVIGPKGEVAQIGSLNDRLWHAGKSNWGGYRDLNGHSIGIEVTCPGWGTLIKSGPDKSIVKLWSNKTVTYYNDEIITTRHKNSKEKHTWILFNEIQLRRIADVGAAIMDHYNLQEAVGHDMIAPTRKIDPGPCCPDSLFHLLNGNGDSYQEDMPTENIYQVFGVGTVGLNFRAWPSSKSRIIKILAENTLVSYIRNKGKWWLVDHDGVHGWVYSDYLK